LSANQFAQRCGISRSEAIRIALTEYPNTNGHEELHGEVSLKVGGHYEPELQDSLREAAVTGGTTVSAIARARIAALLDDASWGLNAAAE
jgi:hypothetical protein